MLRDTFTFLGIKGATYDVFSRSFFDPFILRIFDQYGNTVAVDTDQLEYGKDVIFDYVAPYTGWYYVSASWDQGEADSHKYVSLSIYEDIDTVSYNNESSYADEAVYATDDLGFGLVWFGLV
ncbi:hypothetical protein [Oleiphilus messinensis]|nr:hypothetical protein [Oleiphilus messinensis]